MSDESAKNRSEEEESFTFVDRRRTGAEEEPAEAAPESDPVVEADDLDDSSGPNATYQIALYALGLMQMNAFQQLGLMADPSTGKAHRDLDQARIGIDCVAALASVLDSPASQLDERVRGDIRRVLTDLRLNFVTQSQLASQGN